LTCQSRRRLSGSSGAIRFRRTDPHWRQRICRSSMRCPCPSCWACAPALDVRPPIRSRRSVVTSTRLCARSPAAPGSWSGTLGERGRQRSSWAVHWSGRSCAQPHQCAVGKVAGLAGRQPARGHPRHYAGCSQAPTGGAARRGGRSRPQRFTRDDLLTAITEDLARRVAAPRGDDVAMVTVQREV